MPDLEYKSLGNGNSILRLRGLDITSRQGKSIDLSCVWKEENWVFSRHQRTVHHPREENLQMLDLSLPGSETGSLSSDI